MNTAPIRALLLLFACGCSAEAPPVEPANAEAPADTAKEVPETPPAPAPTLPPIRPAPPLDVWEWTNGDAPSFAGKPILIEFWATWCTPCIRSTPHIVELARKYESQGLVTVGIHVKTHIDEQKIKEFISAFAIPYPIGVDRAGTVYDAYNVGEHIPRSYLVSHEGQIVWYGNSLTDKEHFDGLVARVVEEANR